MYAQCNTTKILLLLHSLYSHHYGILDNRLSCAASTSEWPHAGLHLSYRGLNNYVGQCWKRGQCILMTHPSFGLWLAGVTELVRQPQCYQFHQVLRQCRNSDIYPSNCLNPWMSENKMQRIHHIPNPTVDVTCLLPFQPILVCAHSHQTLVVGYLLFNSAMLMDALWSEAPDRAGGRAMPTYLFHVWIDHIRKVWPTGTWVYAGWVRCETLSFSIQISCSYPGFSLSRTDTHRVRWPRMTAAGRVISSLAPSMSRISCQKDAISDENNQPYPAYKESSWLIESIKGFRTLSFMTAGQ